MMPAAPPGVDPHARVYLKWSAEKNTFVFVVSGISCHLCFPLFEGVRAAAINRRQVQVALCERLAAHKRIYGMDLDVGRAGDGDEVMENTIAFIEIACMGALNPDLKEVLMRAKRRSPGDLEFVQNIVHEFNLKNAADELRRKMARDHEEAVAQQKAAQAEFRAQLLKNCLPRGNLPAYDDAGKLRERSDPEESESDESRMRSSDGSLESGFESDELRESAPATRAPLPKGPKAPSGGRRRRQARTAAAKSALGDMKMSGKEVIVATVFPELAPQTGPESEAFKQQCFKAVAAKEAKRRAARQPKEAIPAKEEPKSDGELAEQRLGEQLAGSDPGASKASHKEAMHAASDGYAKFETMLRDELKKQRDESGFATAESESSDGEAELAALKEGSALKWQKPKKVCAAARVPFLVGKVPAWMLPEKVVLPTASKTKAPVKKTPPKKVIPPHVEFPGTPPKRAGLFKGVPMPWKKALAMGLNRRWPRFAQLLAIRRLGQTGKWEPREAVAEYEVAFGAVKAWRQSNADRKRLIRELREERAAKRAERDEKREAWLTHKVKRVFGRQNRWKAEEKANIGEFRRELLREWRSKNITLSDVGAIAQEARTNAFTEAAWCGIPFEEFKPQACSERGRAAIAAELVWRQVAKAEAERKARWQKWRQALIDRGAARNERKAKRKAEVEARWVSRAERRAGRHFQRTGEKLSEAKRSELVKSIHEQMQIERQYRYFGRNRPDGYGYGCIKTARSDGLVAAPGELERLMDDWRLGSGDTFAESFNHLKFINNPYKAHFVPVRVTDGEDHVGWANRFRCGLITAKHLFELTERDQSRYCIIEFYTDHIYVGPRVFSTRDEGRMRSALRRLFITDDACRRISPGGPTSRVKMDEVLLTFKDGELKTHVDGVAGPARGWSGKMTNLQSGGVAGGIYHMLTAWNERTQQCLMASDLSLDNQTLQMNRDYAEASGGPNDWRQDTYVLTAAGQRRKFGIAALITVLTAIVVWTDGPLHQCFNYRDHWYCTDLPEPEHLLGCHHKRLWGQRYVMCDEKHSVHPWDLKNLPKGSKQGQWHRIHVQHVNEDIVRGIEDSYRSHSYEQEHLLGHIITLHGQGGCVFSLEAPRVWRCMANSFGANKHDALCEETGDGTWQCQQRFQHSSWRQAVLKRYDAKWLSPIDGYAVSKFEPWMLKDSLVDVDAVACNNGMKIMPSVGKIIPHQWKFMDWFQCSYIADGMLCNIRGNYDCSEWNGLHICKNSDAELLEEFVNSTLRATDCGPVKFGDFHRVGLTEIDDSVRAGNYTGPAEDVRRAKRHLHGESHIWTLYKEGKLVQRQYDKWLKELYRTRVAQPVSTVRDAIFGTTRKPSIFGAAAAEQPRTEYTGKYLVPLESGDCCSGGFKVDVDSMTGARHCIDPANLKSSPADSVPCGVPCPKDKVVKVGYAEGNTKFIWCGRYTAAHLDNTLPSLNAFAARTSRNTAHRHIWSGVIVDHDGKRFPVDTEESRIAQSICQGPVAKEGGESSSRVLGSSLTIHCATVLPPNQANSTRYTEEDGHLKIPVEPYKVWQVVAYWGTILLSAAIVSQITRSSAAAILILLAGTIWAVSGTPGMGAECYTHTDDFLNGDGMSVEFRNPRAWPIVAYWGAILLSAATISQITRNSAAGFLILLLGSVWAVAGAPECQIGGQVYVENRLNGNGTVAEFKIVGPVQKGACWRFEERMIVIQNITHRADYKYVGTVPNEVSLTCEYDYGCPWGQAESICKKHESFAWHKCVSLAQSVGGPCVYPGTTWYTVGCELAHPAEPTRETKLWNKGDTFHSYHLTLCEAGQNTCVDVKAGGSVTIAEVTITIEAIEPHEIINLPVLAQSRGEWLGSNYPMELGSTCVAKTEDINRFDDDACVGFKAELRGFEFDVQYERSQAVKWWNSTLTNVGALAGNLIKIADGVAKNSLDVMVETPIAIVTAVANKPAQLAGTMCNKATFVVTNVRPGISQGVHSATVTLIPHPEPENCLAVVEDYDCTILSNPIVRLVTDRVFNITMICGFSLSTRMQFSIKNAKVTVPVSGVNRDFNYWISNRIKRLQYRFAENSFVSSVVDLVGKGLGGLGRIAPMVVNSIAGGAVVLLGGLFIMNGLIVPGLVFIAAGGFWIAGHYAVAMPTEIIGDEEMGVAFVQSLQHQVVVALQKVLAIGALHSAVLQPLLEISVLRSLLLGIVMSGSIVCRYANCYLLTGWLLAYWFKQYALFGIVVTGYWVYAFKSDDGDQAVLIGRVIGTGLRAIELFFGEAAQWFAFPRERSTVIAESLISTAISVLVVRGFSLDFHYIAATWVSAYTGLVVGRGWRQLAWSAVRMWRSGIYSELATVPTWAERIHMLCRWPEPEVVSNDVNTFLPGRYRNVPFWREGITSVAPSKAWKQNGTGETDLADLVACYGKRGNCQVKGGYIWMAERQPGMVEAIVPTHVLTESMVLRPEVLSCDDISWVWIRANGQLVRPTAGSEPLLTKSLGLIESEVLLWQGKRVRIIHHQGKSLMVDKAGQPYPDGVIGLSGYVFSGTDGKKWLHFQCRNGESKNARPVLAKLKNLVGSQTSRSSYSTVVSSAKSSPRMQIDRKAVYVIDPTGKRYQDILAEAIAAQRSTQGRIYVGTIAPIEHTCEIDRWSQQDFPYAEDEGEIIRMLDENQAKWPSLIQSRLSIVELVGLLLDHYRMVGSRRFCIAMDGGDQTQAALNSLMVTLNARQGLVPFALHDGWLGANVGGFIVEAGWKGKMINADVYVGRSNPVHKHNIRTAATWLPPSDCALTEATNTARAKQATLQELSVEITQRQQCLCSINRSRPVQPQSPRSESVASALSASTSLSGVAIQEPIHEEAEVPASSSGDSTAKAKRDIIDLYPEGALSTGELEAQLSLDGAAKVSNGYIYGVNGVIFVPMHLVRKDERRHVTHHGDDICSYGKTVGERKDAFKKLSQTMVKDADLVDGQVLTNRVGLPNIIVKREGKRVRLEFEGHDGPLPGASGAMYATSKGDSLFVRAWHPKRGVLSNSNFSGNCTHEGVVFMAWKVQVLDEVEGLMVSPTIGDGTFSIRYGHQDGDWSQIRDSEFYITGGTVVERLAAADQWVDETLSLVKSLEPDDDEHTSIQYTLPVPERVTPTRKAHVKLVRHEGAERCCDKWNVTLEMIKEVNGRRRTMAVPFTFIFLEVDHRSHQGVLPMIKWAECTPGEEGRSVPCMTCKVGEMFTSVEYLAIHRVLANGGFDGDASRLSLFAVQAMRRNARNADADYCFDKALAAASDASLDLGEKKTQFVEWVEVLLANRDGLESLRSRDKWDSPTLRSLVERARIDPFIRSVIVDFDPGMKDIIAGSIICAGLSDGEKMLVDKTQEVKRLLSADAAKLSAERHPWVNVSDPLSEANAPGGLKSYISSHGLFSENAVLLMHVASYMRKYGWGVARGSSMWRSCHHVVESGSVFVSQEVACNDGQVRGFTVELLNEIADPSTDVAGSIRFPMENAQPGDLCVVLNPEAAQACRWFLLICGRGTHKVENKTRTTWHPVKVEFDGAGEVKRLDLWGNFKASGWSGLPIFRLNDGAIVGIYGNRATDPITMRQVVVYEGEQESVHITEKYSKISRGIVDMLLAGGSDEIWPMVVGGTGTGKSTRFTLILMKMLMAQRKYNDVTVMEPTRGAATGLYSTLSELIEREGTMFGEIKLELKVGQTAGGDESESKLFNVKSGGQVNHVLRIATTGWAVRHSYGSDALVIVDEAHMKSEDVLAALTLLKSGALGKLFGVILMTATPTAALAPFAAKFGEEVTAKRFAITEHHYYATESSIGTCVDIPPVVLGGNLPRPMKVRVDDIRGNRTLVLCPTKSAAEQAADMWNREYHANVGVKAYAIHAGNFRSGMPSDGSFIIFGTDVCSTAVTIKDLRYVCLSGYMNRPMMAQPVNFSSHDIFINEEMQIIPITEELRRQMIGRVGRTCPGSTYTWLPSEVKATPDVEESKVPLMHAALLSLIICAGRSDSAMSLAALERYAQLHEDDMAKYIRYLHPDGEAKDLLCWHNKVDASQLLSSRLRYLGLVGRIGSGEADDVSKLRLYVCTAIAQSDLDKLEAALSARGQSQTNVSKMLKKLWIIKPTHEEARAENKRNQVDVSVIERADPESQRSTFVAAQLAVAGPSEQQPRRGKVQKTRAGAAKKSVNESLRSGLEKLLGEMDAADESKDSAVAGGLAAAFFSAAALAATMKRMLSTEDSLRTANDCYTVVPARLPEYIRGGSQFNGETFSFDRKQLDSLIKNLKVFLRDRWGTLSKINCGNKEFVSLEKVAPEQDSLEFSAAFNEWWIVFKGWLLARLHDVGAAISATGITAWIASNPLFSGLLGFNAFLGTLFEPIMRWSKVFGILVLVGIDTALQVYGQALMGNLGSVLVTVSANVGYLMRWIYDDASENKKHPRERHQYYWAAGNGMAVMAAWLWRNVTVKDVATQFGALQAGTSSSGNFLLAPNADANAFVLYKTVTYAVCDLVEMITGGGKKADFTTLTAWFSNLAAGGAVWHNSSWSGVLTAVVLGVCTAMGLMTYRSMIDSKEEHFANNGKLGSLAIQLCNDMETKYCSVKSAITMAISAGAIVANPASIYTVMAALIVNIGERVVLNDNPDYVKRPLSEEVWAYSGIGIMGASMSLVQRILFLGFDFGAPEWTKVFRSDATGPAERFSMPKGKDSISIGMFLFDVGTRILSAFVGALVAGTPLFIEVGAKGSEYARRAYDKITSWVVMIKDYIWSALVGCGGLARNAICKAGDVAGQGFSKGFVRTILGDKIGWFVTDCDKTAFISNKLWAKSEVLTDPKVIIATALQSPVQDELEIEEFEDAILDPRIPTRHPDLDIGPHIYFGWHKSVIIRVSRKFPLGPVIRRCEELRWNIGLTDLDPAVMRLKYQLDSCQTGKIYEIENALRMASVNAIEALVTNHPIVIVSDYISNMEIPKSTVLYKRCVVSADDIHPTGTGSEYFSSRWMDRGEAEAHTPSSLENLMHKFYVDPTNVEYNARIAGGCKFNRMVGQQPHQDSSDIPIVNVLTREFKKVVEGYRWWSMGKTKPETGVIRFLGDAERYFSVPRDPAFSREILKINIEAEAKKIEAANEDMALHSVEQAQIAQQSYLDDGIYLGFVWVAGARSRKPGYRSDLMPLRRDHVDDNALCTLQEYFKGIDSKYDKLHLGDIGRVAWPDAMIGDTIVSKGSAKLCYLDQVLGIFDNTPMNIFVPAAGFAGFEDYISQRLRNSACTVINNSLYVPDHAMPRRYIFEPCKGSLINPNSKVSIRAAFKVPFERNDIRHPEVIRRFEEVMGLQSQDLIISDMGEANLDMWAETSWLTQKKTNKGEMLSFAGALLQMRDKLLKQGGNMLVKIHGVSKCNESFIRELAGKFHEIFAVRAGTTSMSSREWYLWCKGYSPKANLDVSLFINNLRWWMHERLVRARFLFHSALKNEEKIRAKGLHGIWKPVKWEWPSDLVGHKELISGELTTDEVHDVGFKTYVVRRPGEPDIVFEPKIDERVSQVLTTVLPNARQKLDREAPAAFKNCRSYGKFYHNKESISKLRKVALVYKILRSGFGCEPVTSTVGVTQQSIASTLKSYQDRLDKAPKDPKWRDRDLLRQIRDQMYTPEALEVIKNGGFKPCFDLEKLKSWANLKGAAGKYDPVDGMREFFELPDCVDRLKARYLAMERGHTVPTWITARNKKETKSVKNIDDLGGKIKPKGYDSWTYNQKYEYLQEQLNVTPRQIQFADCESRAFDLCLFGEMMEFHSRHPLYKGKISGVPLHVQGNVLRAIWDSYLPEEQREIVGEYLTSVKIKPNKFHKLARKIAVASGDFSKWDGTVSKFDLLELEMCFILPFYTEPVQKVIANRYRHFTWAVVITDLGHVLGRSGQRSSGDQFTSFGNSLINNIYHFAATALVEGWTAEEACQITGVIEYRFNGVDKHFYLHPVTHVADGDDNVHIGPSEMIERLVSDTPEFMESCGKKIRSETSGGYSYGESFNRLTFCSHYYRRVLIGPQAEVLRTDWVRKTNYNEIVRRIRSQGGDPAQHKVHYMATRSLAIIFGKLMTTLKMKLAVYDPSDAEGISMLRGKVLSCLLQYPHMRRVRAVCLTALSIIGEGEWMLEDKMRRKPISYAGAQRTVAGALESVYGVDTLDQIHLLSVREERLWFDAVIRNSRLLPGRACARTMWQLIVEMQKCFIQHDVVQRAPNVLDLDPWIRNLWDKVDEYVTREMREGRTRLMALNDFDDLLGIDDPLSAREEKEELWPSTLAPEMKQRLEHESVSDVAADLMLPDTRVHGVEMAVVVQQKTLDSLNVTQQLQNAVLLDTLWKTSSFKSDYRAATGDACLYYEMAADGFDGVFVDWWESIRDVCAGKVIAVPHYKMARLMKLGHRVVGVFSDADAEVKGSTCVDQVDLFEGYVEAWNNLRRKQFIRPDNEALPEGCKFTLRPSKKFELVLCGDEEYNEVIRAMLGEIKGSWDTSKREPRDWWLAYGEKSKSVGEQKLVFPGKQTPRRWLPIMLRQLHAASVMG